MPEKTKLYNEIILTESNQGKTDISKVLGDTILTLIKEDEVCKVFGGDCGTYVIQHNHNEEHTYLGEPELVWVDADSQVVPIPEDNSEASEESDNADTFTDKALEFTYQVRLLLDKFNNREINSDDIVRNIHNLMLQIDNNYNPHSDTKKSVSEELGILGE